MGSKQKTKQKQKTDQTSTTEVTGIQPYQDQFKQDYGNLMNTWQTLLNNKPTLNYTDKPWSEGFSPIVQNTLSQGQQAIKQGQAAADRSLASNLSVAGTGDNSALLSVLKRQGQTASAGAANSLYAPALAQQREMDVQNQNLIAQQNQQKLADYVTGIQGLQPGFNLLQTLQGMAGISAGKKTHDVGQTATKVNTSKGFF